MFKQNTYTIDAGSGQHLRRGSIIKVEPMTTFTDSAITEAVKPHPFSNGNKDHPTPKTDTTCVRRYLKLFNECAAAACAGIANPGFIQMCCIDKNGAIFRRFKIGDVETMTAIAVTWSESGAGNVYIEGRTIRADAPTGSKLRGKKEHTGAVFALTIDNDPDKLMGASLPLEPTIRTETSPGNTHETYFLEKAVTPDVGEELGYLLKTAIGTSDFDTGTITQPYRVAGTINYVSANKRERGRTDCETKILSVDKAYDVDEFRAFLKASGGYSKKERIQSQTTFGSTDKAVDELLARSWWKAELEQELSLERHEDRSRGFHGLIGMLQRDRYTPAESYRLIAAYPNSCWNAKYGNRLEAEIMRSWGKIEFEDKQQRSEESASYNTFDSDARSNSESGKTGDGDQQKSSSDYWTFGDELPKEPPSLIKGLVPAQRVFFVGGQSGAGKSFIANQMAMALASGRPFFGHEIPEPGGTIIIASEGGDTIAPRLMAAQIGLELDNEARPIAVIRHNIGDLSAPSDFKALIVRLQSVAADILARFGVPVKMVLIDTVSAAFSLKDENSSAETARMCKGLAGLGECINALAVGVHHYGKSSESGLRGSSAIRAAADGVLAVMGERDELTGKCANRRIVLTKSRSGVEGAVYPFELQSVEVSSDGFDAIMSAKVVALEGGAEFGHGQARGATRGGKGLGCLMSALRQSLLDFGRDERVFADGPILRVVDREKVRENFYANTSGDGTPQQIASRRRQAWRRASDTAEELGHIKCFEKNGVQLMWLLKEEA